MSLFIRHIHTSVVRIAAKNHYQVLGVSNSATSKEIRAAFIRLSKELHPDVNKLTPKESDVSFVDVNEAYSVLSNPTTRREYDLRQTQRPSFHYPHQSAGPFTSQQGPGHQPWRSHYYHRAQQQNMYHYNEERRFSNGAVAGFLCIFIFVGGVLQFIRISGFMETQRAAAERSRRQYMLYTMTKQKAQRNNPKI